MSGYIQLDKDLQRDGRVLDLGDKLYAHLRQTLGLPDSDVLRYVMRNALLGSVTLLWCYADEFVTADNTLRVTPEHLAELIGLPLNVLKAMPKKWLVIRDENTIELPEYVQKNGITDKDIRRENDRNKNAERQKRYRERQKEKHRNDSNDNVTSRNAVTEPSRNVTPRARARVPSHPIPSEDIRPPTPTSGGALAKGPLEPESDAPSVTPPPRNSRANGTNPRAVAERENAPPSVQELAQSIRDEFHLSEFREPTSVEDVATYRYACSLAAKEAGIHPVGRIRDFSGPTDAPSTFVAKSVVRHETLDSVEARQERARKLHASSPALERGTLAKLTKLSLAELNAALDVPP